MVIDLRQGVAPSRAKNWLSEPKQLEMTSWRHEQRVRERASAIWERAGRPEDQAAEHWRQAAAEIAAEEGGLEQEIALAAAGAV